MQITKTKEMLQKGTIVFIGIVAILYHMVYATGTDSNMNEQIDETSTESSIENQSPERERSGAYCTNMEITEGSNEPAEAQRVYRCEGKGMESGGRYKLILSKTTADTTQTVEIAQPRATDNQTYAEFVYNDFMPGMEVAAGCVLIPRYSVSWWMAFLQDIARTIGQLVGNLIAWINTQFGDVIGGEIANQVGDPQKIIDTTQAGAQEIGQVISSFQQGREAANACIVREKIPKDVAE